MQPSITSQDIQAAGGLQKWLNAGGKMPNRPKPTVQSDTPRTSKGKGRLPKDGFIGFAGDRMNKLEASFAAVLESWRREGKIVCWQYEAIRLVTADRTTYCPDFFVMLNDGTLGFYETKGFWRDDARVKIKTAARQFPMYFFTAVQCKKGKWLYEQF